jgi:NAD(P)-dependent dehydrogenase (short-subunit alcohol dehydrogenase family)
MNPTGKVALVTGAGYGIGRGIAKQLAAADARIVVDDIHDEHGAETVRMIENAGGQAAFVHGDTTKEEDVRRMIAFAMERFGGLDIIVNNAGGGFGQPYYPNNPLAEWRTVLDWYLYAYMEVIQESLRAMSGGGVIVNVSSMAGVGYKSYWYPEYAAAKAAIIRLTAALGFLAQTQNVRVNCICPNWVATEAVNETVAAMSVDQRKARHVPDNLATPEDIGDAILDFVRDDTMAGRILHHFAPGEQWLVPVEAEY